MYEPFSGDMFGLPAVPEPKPQQPIGEAEKILQGLLADLPDEVQILVNKVDREMARIREQSEEECAQIRDHSQRRIAEAETKAENRRLAQLQHAIEQLEPLQKDLFRQGELGKAMATFVQIQAFKNRVQEVQPDPGSLVRFQQIGKSLLFRVMGRNQGPVWGTDIYTADSHLGTAAVHAGALDAGEEQIVKVSVVDMSGVPVRGSFRNGVSSMDWEPFRLGFRVCRA